MKGCCHAPYFVKLIIYLGHLTFLASFVQVACGLAGALESGQRDREGVRRRHQGGQEALPCAISPFAHGCAGQSQVFLTTSLGEHGDSVEN